MVGLFVLALWGTYLLFGPFVLFMGFVGGEGFGAAIFGLVVTVVGFLVLRKLTKWFARPLWYRRN